MTNRELAKVFQTIADLLEIKGEVVFKIRAYRRASESLLSQGREVQDLLAEGADLTQIQGIGKAIAEKIEELENTGKLEYLEKLEQEVPVSLISMMQVPDMGPKKTALIWHELDITTIDQLEAAARAGQLRDLPGLGEKSEAKIIDGIESLKRRSGRTLLGEALPIAQELIRYFKNIEGVKQVEAAGSLRRMRATVGDIDILVAAEDSTQIMDSFVNRADVVRVLGKGQTKASVEFTNGMRAQVWVHLPDRYGTALQYATGSKDHNVRLRELALSKGLSLSEHALARNDGTEILCAEERQVYEALGIPWIPPELREDRGEIQAAIENRLPMQLKRDQIIAELHTHSTWSDGKVTIREMVQAAIDRGYRVLAITDHSHGLGIVQGMHPEDIIAQRQEIDLVQGEFGDRILILQGAEVEIKADGSLDYTDDILRTLDIVIASLHVSLRQPRAQVTARLINTIQNPNVDIIGHPTGRLLPDREGADLDMEAVLKAAAESGVCLEINAHPKRLDLEDIYARRAVELGIPITINTDAHQPDNLDLIVFGIATARRGWVEPKDVINTWAPEKLTTWLKQRGN
jgi:DNA polymerase (family 10)